MTPLEETLEYINCARVAVKAGYKQMALDFLADAENSLKQDMPQRITVMPNVELCEELEKELEQI